MLIDSETSYLRNCEFSSTMPFGIFEGATISTQSLTFPMLEHDSEILRTQHLTLYADLQGTESHELLVNNSPIQHMLVGFPSPTNLELIGLISIRTTELVSLLQPDNRISTTSSRDTIYRLYSSESLPNDNMQSGFFTKKSSTSFGKSISIIISLFIGTSIGTNTLS